jgi:hypothetical protein
MTSPAKTTNKFKSHRHRRGVCHRCGWRGSVAKVGRRNRALLRTDRACGRLCDECVEDLLADRGRSPGERAPGPGRSNVSGDLDVA